MVRLAIIFTFVLAGGFIIAQMLDFFLSINSGSSQTRKDIAELKSKIATYISSLIPMTIAELELLSVNQTGSTSSKGLSTIKSGAFTTIYHEPLLAYAYKKYTYPADKSLLLISSEDDDFIYMINGGKTQVFVNNKELGFIESDGSLFAPRTNKLLAKIEANHLLSSHPVRIDDKEVGEIVNVRLNESPNPRAYQFLEPMNNNETQIFKALTFLSLIEETL